MREIGWRDHSREGILEVSDPRLASDPLHGNDVYAPVIDKILLGIVLRAGLHVRLFPRTDRDFGRTKAPGCSRLDLDEHREFILAGHKVDFSVGRAQIPIQQFVSAGREVVRRRLLTPSSDTLISTHLVLAAPRGAPCAFVPALGQHM